MSSYTLPRTGIHVIRQFGLGLSFGWDVAVGFHIFVTLGPIDAWVRTKR